MKQVDPCQLNAAIAVITNQLYCSMSRREFIDLGAVLSMLSRSILHMAAIEDLLKWEHRDLRAERLLREAKKRRPKPRPGPTPSALPTEEALVETEELAEEEELLVEEELAAEGEF